MNAYPLKPLHPREVLFVTGKRGKGKSSFVKRHLALELKAGRRILCIDPHDEYSRAGRKTPEVELGPLATHCTVDELQQRPLEILQDPRLSLSVVIRRRPDEAAEDVEDIIELVESAGDLLLVLDEVGLYRQHCAETMFYVATQSRHWGAGVPVIFVAQRAVHLHPDARAQAAHFVSFRQDNPADVSAIAELTRDQAFADAVACLGVGEFRHWQDS